jgi:hypothetical protein
MKELFENENVNNFITSAANYCTLVENAGNFSKKDFIEKTLELFSSLYYSIFRFPSFEIESDEEMIEKFVTEQEWNNIYQRVSHKLGYHDDYLDLYDPVARQEEDLSVGKLSDNLADIYQDMKDFVTLYGVGNEDVMLASLWECKISFEEYWGQKLLNATRVLHRLYFYEENLEEDENSEDQADYNENRNNWMFNRKQEQYRKGEK